MNIYTCDGQGVHYWHLFDVFKFAMGDTHAAKSSIQSRFKKIFSFQDIGCHVFRQNTATFLLRHYVISKVM
jgi:hypothetical protein